MAWQLPGQDLLDSLTFMVSVLWKLGGSPALRSGVWKLRGRHVQKISPTVQWGMRCVIPAPKVLAGALMHRTPEREVLPICGGHAMETLLCSTECCVCGTEYIVYAVLAVPFLS